MVRLAFVIFCTALLASCVATKIVYRPAPDQAIVTRIVDGDTLEVRCDSSDGLTWLEKVRLFGLNAPEMDEPGGEEAKRAMQDQWPIGARIALEYPERKRDGTVVWRDNFGRLLATIRHAE